jgi:tRNA-modifying protein YgfZ
MTADELSSLSSGLGIADFSDRSRVAVVGDDAAKLLNNLCTNDVLKLRVGEWCEGFFLNAKGGVLFYVRLFKGEMGFDLDLEPNLSAAVVKHIDRYIIREKATLHDNTATTSLLHVCGGAAKAAIQQLGEVAEDEIVFHQIARTPFPGFDVVGPVASKNDIIARLSQSLADAMTLSPDDAERLRVLAGLPAFGKEIKEGCLAQEIDRIPQTISFTKGCYIGQETVARLDALGHTNKVLRGLILVGADRPADGASIRFNDKEVGTVASSALALDGATTMCLAIVRTAAANPGTSVLIDGRPAVVSALPFAG